MKPKTNRLISFMLCFVMLLGLMPCAVYAGGTANAATWAELQSALSDSSVSTIEVTQNIEQTVTADAGLADIFLNLSSGSKEINLNGNTLSYVNNENVILTSPKLGLFNVSGTAELTVSNGTITYTNYLSDSRDSVGAFAVSGSAKLTLNNVTLTNERSGCAVALSGSSSAELNGGTITSYDGYAVCTSDSAALTLAQGVVLTTYDGTGHYTVDGGESYGALKFRSSGELKLSNVQLFGGVQIDEAATYAFSTADHWVVVNGYTYFEDFGTSRADSIDYRWHTTNCGFYVLISTADSTVAYNIKIEETAVPYKEISAAAITGIDIPVVDEKPDLTAVIDDNANYTISSFSWWEIGDDTTQRQLGDYDTFKKATVYEVRFVLSAKDGYMFACSSKLQDNISINNCRAELMLTYDYGTDILIGYTFLKTEGEKETPKEPSYPVIISHPSDAGAYEGENVTMSITAFDADTYQWQSSEDGTYFTDMGTEAEYTAPTLTISNVTKAEHDGKYYRCVASNEDGYTTSFAAKLLVADSSEIPGINLSMSSNLQVGSTLPQVGAKSQYYTVENYLWYEGYTVKTALDSNAIVEADKLYTLEAVIRTESAFNRDFKDGVSAQIYDPHKNGYLPMTVENQTTYSALVSKTFTTSTSSIEILVKEPVAGEMPSEPVFANDENLKDMISYDWINVSAGSKVTTAFEAGNTYKLNINYIILTNKYFTDNAQAFINGEEVSYDSILDNNYMLGINYSWTLPAAYVPKTDIDAVNISLSEPVIDAKVSDAKAITSDTEYIITDTSWKPNDSKFQPSTVYTAAVTITANDGYQFNNGTSFNINGNDVIITSLSNDKAVLEYTFPATGGIISAVNLSAAAPVTGAAPANAVAAEGTYTAALTSWEPADEQFKADTEYTIVVSVEAASNNFFNDSTAFYINGKEATVITKGADQAKVSYTFPKTTDIKELMLGDVNDDGTLTAMDAAIVLQYALTGSAEILSGDNLIKAELDGNGTITANDSACIIAKSLDSSYVFPVEAEG